jgi:Dolichyl-phosphate-mannose-protein mannosyltransferase
VSAGAGSVRLLVRRAATLARRRPELAALYALLLVGLAARIYFMVVWRPAITGYSDSGVYFQDAVQGIWSDPIRTVGYGMFLTVLHAITPHLLLVTAVQHLIGLAVAVLAFLTVRRIGGPPWLGLVPAAIIALGGDELFIEHAALSETVSIFLLTLMLYCCVRAAADGGLAWAAAAGLCAGLGVWDRGAAISLLPIAPLWLLLCRRRPTRRSVALGAVSLVIALGSVGGYIEWRQLASGLSGLTTNGNWNLYGRVAPWADCTKFTPPPGTQQLCDATPPAERAGHSAEYYIYSPDSPAQRLIGPPYAISPDRYAMSRLWEFSLSAISGQPLDYLNAVWQDTLRLVDPNHPSYGDLSADQFIAFLLGGPDYRSGQNEFVTYWQQREYPHDSIHRGAIAPLKAWEKLTRFDGPWMVALLLLCLAAPWVVAGEARAGARLLSATTLVLLLFPLFTKGYDYRFVIPAFGPLFASGALAAWGITTRVRRRAGTA